MRWDGSTATTTAPSTTTTMPTTVMVMATGTDTGMATTVVKPPADT